MGVLFWDRVDSGAARREEGFWVAVLPFKHRGADPGIEALAEGLTEDIVTGLARFSYLRVIARSSTSRSAGESVDVRWVGQELGARYVMEGSVRQAGSTLRVAAQLVGLGWATLGQREKALLCVEQIRELQSGCSGRLAEELAAVVSGSPSRQTKPN